MTFASIQRIEERTMFSIFRGEFIVTPSLVSGYKK